MRSIILLAMAVCSSTAMAGRPPQNFGFGPPPSYPQTMQHVADHLNFNLKDPDSVKALVISRPVADCHGRGHLGRREVCGYRVCVTFNAKNSFGGYAGRETRVLWLYNGFSPVSYANAGFCPNSFPAWSGDPPVSAVDFCRLQPKHPECVAGRREGLVELGVEESVGAPLIQPGSQVGQCSDEMRDTLRAKGMTYADIAEVCDAG